MSKIYSLFLCVLPLLVALSLPKCSRAQKEYSTKGSMVCSQEQRG
ncbi:hypothetical protein OIU77_006501 [Salix suchowensis]|uniref:Uncharacterized protein n=1 Tax=Salix suchowensis TaxID=1278906 RepID=A0ABQ9ANB9_9ROSI|nr:hypothetical protein OIU77_006501 [Salix suchowensis]